MNARAIRSVLIVRLSALGDVVMASPLIPALRARYPEARIAWLVQPEVVELLRANPRLDELIVWPRAKWRQLYRERQWSRLVSEVRGFVRELRSRRFDLALDGQGLLKSGVLAWLSGASRRVGVGSIEGSRWLMTEVVPKDFGDPRMSSEYLALAERLGLPTEPFAPDIVVAPEAASSAERILAERGLANGFAALCPFTTRPQKHWFEERWPVLAARLRSEAGLRSVVLGGPGDREAASRICAGDQAMVDLAGATTVGQAVALIARARLVVGVDTGLTHLGTAFALPTVALFGSTRPYLETVHASTRVLYEALPCAPCQRNPTCDGAFTCMRDISVDEVVATAVGMLT